MTATYDPTLATDRDHVRRISGDVKTSSAFLSDEEIDAILTEETSSGQALKYFASATALEILRVEWAGKGEGVRSKNVGQLGITYGSDTTADQALASRISWLRKRGAFLHSPDSKVFRIL